MCSSTDLFIEDLLKHREVTHYDTFAMISVPGATTDEIKLRVMERLRNDPSLTTAAGGIDAQELCDRLRDITPPVDEDEFLEECRALERDARIELEQEGCPPCYPSHLDIPLENVPLECQAITSYWEADARPSKVVLAAQLNDWKQFRRTQTKWRQSSRIAQSMDKFRKRDTNVNWTHVDPALKSRLENWEDFEYFHNNRHTKLEKEHSDEVKKRDEAEKNPDPTYITEMGMTHVHVYETRRNLVMDKLRTHEILLRWIQEKKSEMMTRILEAEETLLSKQHSKPSRRKDATAQMRNRIKRVSGRAEPSRAKQAGQGRASIRSPPKAQSNARGYAQGSAQSRRVLCGTETRTRSGRISKPPMRWVPR